MSSSSSSRPTSRGAPALIGSLVKPPSGRPVRRLVALVSALLPVEGRVFLPVHLVRGVRGY